MIKSKLLLLSSICFLSISVNSALAGDSGSSTFSCTPPLTEAVKAGINSEVSTKFLSSFCGGTSSDSCKVHSVITSLRSFKTITPSTGTKSVVVTNDAMLGNILNIDSSSSISGSTALKITVSNTLINIPECSINYDVPVKIKLKATKSGAKKTITSNTNVLIESAVK